MVVFLPHPPYVTLSPPPVSAAGLITVLCIILANCLQELLDGHPAVVVSCVVLTLLCGVCVVIIWRQPESKEALTFKVTIKPRSLVLHFDMTNFRLLPGAPLIYTLKYLCRLFVTSSVVSLGSSASLVAPVQCLRQHLPHDAAELGHMVPLRCLDDHRYV